MSLLNSAMDHLNQPGSGVKFIWFIQMVCVFIIQLCVTSIYNGLAVPHMIVLTFLSSGLFVSLYVFDTEIKGRGGWEKVFAKKDGDDEGGEDVPTRASKDAGGKKTD
mmetsp:Transcript_4016/g.8444  ORF Transcript_4016/g.8444 Transcript_4016/m.8444 type:complete len:107 (-) Transcript_4016:114-434(-)